MPSDLFQRVANYEIGLDPDRIRDRIAKKRDTMCQRHADAAKKQCFYEDLVKGVLASEPGVDTMDYGFYISFAKSILSIIRSIPGAAGLNRSVECKRQYWITRGLDGRVLARIRDECFSIPGFTFPTPPA